LSWRDFQNYDSLFFSFWRGRKLLIISFDCVSFSDDNVSDQDAEVSDNHNNIAYTQDLNEAPRKQTSKMEENNNIGELIVIKLPNGLCFVKAWVDSKLDSSILEIVVHDSGHKVIKQSKKPTTSKKAASNRTR
jgi:hypothetical protein